MRDVMERATITAMIELLLGEEVMSDLLESPHEPEMEIEIGEVVVGELDETEKFFYSLLPTERTGRRIRAGCLPFMFLLYEIWWNFVENRHGLCGNLGIRRGWKLVALKREREGEAVIEGKFEEKGKDYN